MYKVFVKDVAIIVTTDKDSFPGHNIFKIKNLDFRKLIKDIESGELSNVVLYSKSKKKLLKRLHKLLPVVVAGGGLALNKENDFLFIHRNGKWDLPKGKTEKGESLEESALREVKEETGCKGLKIDQYLGRTYHVFSRKKEQRLKLTHWYVMHTDYEGKLKPQKKEGIDKAVWLNKDMAQVALENSYSNIKELFPQE